jgi:hypothetical protein
MRPWTLAADNSEPDRRRAVKAGAIAPPLRGFGLDGLTQPRFGLRVQLGVQPGRASNAEQRAAEQAAKNFPRLKPRLNANFSLGEF